VIHILLPVQHVVVTGVFGAQFMEMTSEPELGSDMAKAPMCSPAEQLGQILLFLLFGAVAVNLFTHKLE